MAASSVYVPAPVQVDPPGVPEPGGESLGAIVRRAREARGIDRVVLAVVMGIAPHYLAAIEQDRVCPSASEIEALALRLGVEASRLAGIRERALG
jgi:ribosome-binding protein aMBF1 (putative translation factor)